ncbi:MAG: hypothetical protein AB9869_22380 [Verrucomicrobiia bacterium]
MDVERRALSRRNEGHRRRDHFFAAAGKVVPHEVTALAAVLWRFKGEVGRRAPAPMVMAKPLFAELAGAKDPVQK